MKRSARTGIIVLIIVLAVGFAAVATNLIINGTAKISTNPGDFDIYFIEARAEEGGSAVISNDGKTITYNSKTLLGKGSMATLEYTVHNNSSIYNGEVAINVNIHSEVDGVDYSEYFTVTRTGFGEGTSATIYAKQYRSGCITIKMIKDYFDEAASIDFEITLDVTAAERTSVGEPTEEYLEGTVYDENGEPMVNSSFVAFSQPTYFRTDENGHYKIKIPVGEHHVYYVPNKSLEELIAIEDEWEENEKIEVDGEEMTARQLFAKRIKYYEDVKSTTVDTSITSDIVFNSEDVGDEITIGTEKFVYIETKADGSMVLMAKYPLNLGSCASYNNGGPVVQNKNGNTCKVALSNYETWNIEDTDAYESVQNYVNYLKTINSDYNILSGSLINKNLFNIYYLYEWDAMNCIDVTTSPVGCLTEITLTARRGMEPVSNYDMWLGFLAYDEEHPDDYKGLYFRSNKIGIYSSAQTSASAAVRPIIVVNHK